MRTSRGARMMPPPAGRSRHRRWITDERGAGTVLMIALVAAALFVTVGGLAVSDLLQTRQLAATAADLSALAAAGARVDGDDPCQAAERVMSRHGAVLESCTLHDDDSVQVGARLVWSSPLVGVFGGQVRASARAGPSA